MNIFFEREVGALSFSCKTEDKPLKLELNPVQRPTTPSWDSPELPLRYEHILFSFLLVNELDEL